MKIRLRINGQEFEAEGPDPLIRSHLNEFRSLLGAPAGTPPTPTPPPPADQGSIMFKAEKASKSLTLRVLPSTDQGILKQTTNTLLLILAGFKEALGVLEVPVLAATQSIRQSGLVKTNRLSHAFLALQSDGLAMKLGLGKGTKYKLTAKGDDAARELIHNTLKRAGLS